MANCLACNDGEAKGRGLCKVCHGAAIAMVRRGEATWDEIEALGLARLEKKSLFKAIFLKRKKERADHAT